MTPNDKLLNQKNKCRKKPQKTQITYEFADFVDTTN